MSLLATHYAPIQPDAGVWLPIDFITREAGGIARYQLAFNPEQTFSQDEVDERTGRGALRALARPVPIVAGQRLWLSPEQDIWVASATDPFHDSARWMIEVSALRLARIEGNRAPGIVDASPVIQSIVRKGRLQFILGDYLNSRSDRFGDYEARWQDRLIDRLEKRVSDLTGFSVPRHKLERIEHRYTNVARLIRNRDVAVCFELMFRDTERAAHMIDVVQLGNVTHYALAWLSGARAQELVGPDCEDGEETPRSETWFDFVRDAGITICGHADTAADHFLDDAIQHHRLPGRDRKTEFARISQIVEWAKTHHRDGLLVCDIGSAWQVRNAGLQQLSFVRARYPAPIPAGIAFDATDGHWGSILTEAIHELANSGDPEVRAALRLTAARFPELGAYWTLPIAEGDDPAYPTPRFRHEMPSPLRSKKQ